MIRWLLTAALVHAPLDSDTPLELSWDVPEACGDAAWVRAQVDERLAGRPPPPAALAAAGSALQTERGYQMSLTMTYQGETSERTFEATTCEEVVDTAVLLIVMTLDPLAAAQTEPEPQPEPEPEPDPEPEPQPQPIEQIEPPEPEPIEPRELEPLEPLEPREPPRLEARGRIAGGVGLGPLPSLGGAFELAGGLGAASWAVHATAEAWTPSRAETAAGSTARVWLAAFGAEGCGILRPVRRWSIPLCAGVVVGPMSARGLEIRDPRTRRTAWVAARVQPGVVGWIRPWIGIGAQVSGHVALYRPTFTVDPQGVIHASGRGGFRAGIGLFFRNRRRW